MTGENTGLSVKLLMEHYRRTGNADEARRTWVEAGYCLDAPMLLVAGSHERDVFDEDPELGWLAMPTMTEREPSNAKVSRSAPLLAQVGSTDGLCPGASSEKG